MPPVWELYGGSAGVTRAWRSLHLPTFQPLDVENQSWQDLLRPVVQQWILRRIRSGSVEVIWLSPPCRSFSIMRRAVGTRTAANPSGDGSDPMEVEGNLHAAFVRDVCVAIIAAGGTFVVEHPDGSAMWDLPAFRALRQHPSVIEVVLDQCRFGARAAPPLGASTQGGLIRKRTRLLTNNPAFMAVGRRCQGDHEHQQLRGGVKTAEGWKRQTTLAAAFPPAFCRRVAECTQNALQCRDARNAGADGLS